MCIVYTGRRYTSTGYECVNRAGMYNLKILIRSGDRLLSKYPEQSIIDSLCYVCCTIFLYCVKVCSTPN